MKEEEAESRDSIMDGKTDVLCQCGSKAQKILDTPHQYICTRCGDTFEVKVRKG